MSRIDGVKSTLEDAVARLEAAAAGVGKRQEKAGGEAVVLADALARERVRADDLQRRVDAVATRLDKAIGRFSQNRLSETASRNPKNFGREQETPGQKIRDGGRVA